MATAAQIEANRANAKKSSGPRTPAGKACSSMNNLRDGFRSQSVLLPGDDPAAYQSLLEELTEHFCTCDLTERRAVREMTDAEWRLRRTRRQIEERYWDEFSNIRTQFPDLSETKLDLRTFDSLHQPGSSYSRYLTYEAKSERQYDRAYHQWVQYNKDKTRARSRELADQVDAIFAAPLPEIKLPDRTFEPNPAAATAEIRTDEPNPAPASSPQPEPPRTKRQGTLRRPLGDTGDHSPSFPPPIVDPRVPPMGRPSPSGVSPSPLPARSTENKTTEPNPEPPAPGTNEANSAPPQPPTPQAGKLQTPRNAPCPCGSGLKHKRCCGRNAPPQLFPYRLAA